MTTTATRHRAKHNGIGLKRLHLNGMSNGKSAKSLKRMNRKIVSYIEHKPYQTLGVVAVVASAIAGFLYARTKYFR